jgi:hypothetical protein
VKQTDRETIGRALKSAADTLNHHLAKMAAAGNTFTWRDVEDARSCVRRITEAANVLYGDEEQ